MVDYSLMFSTVALVNIVVTLLSSDAYKQWKDPTITSCDAATATTTTTTIPSDIKQKHSNLLKKYLLVYLLATISDWLQGPYVYALYSSYGFDKQQIAQLFVAGFGSSMIFGSCVGGMADQGGRRQFVIIFSLIYAIGCMTKHFNNYGILMAGRLLGGIATSLLYSVFDAWLIRSHADADLPKHLLSKSFSWASYCNSIVAAFSGITANYFANLSSMIAIKGPFSFGGFLNPFDLALVSVSTCGLLAYFTWEENYGDDRAVLKDEGRNNLNKWYGGVQSALTTTLRNRDILLCGLISSLFEGSMYIFVFMWTPLLKSFLENPDSDELPFGYIFSTFMVCCMAGSSTFNILLEYCGAVEKLAIGVLVLASLAMGVVATAGSDTIALIGMNIFEFCVGMYFPIMGTMKGSIVPEDKRAAIYNLFRIPLNFIVLFSLLTNLNVKVSFTLTSYLLGVATMLQIVLLKRRLENSGISENSFSSKIDEDDLISLKEASV